MKEYIISLILAALLAALINVLTPEGEGGGIAKHMRLLTSLLLLVILAAPLISLVNEGVPLPDGTLLSPDLGVEGEEEYRDRLEEAVSSASKPYFATLLVEALEKEFSIPAGEVRCIIAWDEAAQNVARPEKISIVLSGSAIWKDPSKMEQFVRERIGCECVSAIE